MSKHDAAVMIDCRNCGEFFEWLPWIAGVAEGDYCLYCVGPMAEEAAAED